MWGLVLLCGALLFLGDQWAYFVNTTRTTLNAGETSAIASNMIVYSNYVLAYAKANPAFTGVIPNTSLGLPYWYVQRPDVANYAAAGRGYVYYTGSAQPGISGQIASQTQLNVLAGIVSGGVLVTPQLGNVTSISIPGAVPNGSTVITQ